MVDPTAVVDELVDALGAMDRARVVRAWCGVRAQPGVLLEEEVRRLLRELVALGFGVPTPLSFPTFAVSGFCLHEVNEAAQLVASRYRAIAAGGTDARLLPASSPRAEMLALLILAYSLALGRRARADWLELSRN